MNTEHVLPFSIRAYTVYTIFFPIGFSVHISLHYYLSTSIWSCSKLQSRILRARSECGSCSMPRVATASTLHHRHHAGGRVNAIFILFLFDEWQRNTYSDREEKKKNCIIFVEAWVVWVCIGDCDVVKQKIKCICNVANGECVLCVSTAHRILPIYMYTV